jgi:hypothetical protein
VQPCPCECLGYRFVSEFVIKDGGADGDSHAWHLGGVPIGEIHRTPRHLLVFPRNAHTL